MQFNVNLWHSRSEELAGKLARRELPSHAELKSIEIAPRVIDDASLRSRD